MKRTFISLISILLFFFATGCEEDPCSLTTQSMARFQFLDSKTHAGIKLTEGAMVTGIAIIADTMNVDTLFNQAVSYMSVPLSYTNKTTYVIHYTELMRDTIELTHKNIPFVSNIECEAIMKHEVENFRYTTNALDSVTLVNPQVTNEETINFYIYYRVNNAE